MKKLLIGLALVLVVLVAVVAVRTARYAPEPLAAEITPPPPVEPLEGDIQRFAGALRFRTISHEDSAFDRAEFAAFRDYLTESYPRVHDALERERVGEHALLYTWSGSDPELRPLVLLAHYDVVGVEAATAGDWQHAPFAGDVADGWVWGRGAMDDKASVLSALEAVETLLARGVTPRRTLILAFGHDEEVGGRAGAVRLAARLDSAGVEPEMVLDEGGFIGHDLIAGVDSPVAMVGVAEKGYAAIRLTALGEGGHGSMPPPQTAAGVIAAAVARLEAEPMPARLTPISRRMFDRLGPTMPLDRRVVLANLWLFEPVLLRMLEAGPASNATIRTTTAATMLEGSIKANVLPDRASAVLNFRILPGDSLAGVLEHVRQVVDDERVEVETVGFASEPSAVAPTAGPAFDRLTAAIRAVAPDALITPYLFVAATDARHYGRLTDRVYRFMPIRVTPELMTTPHGTDERIRVEDYRRLVDFYARLMRGD